MQAYSVPCWWVGWWLWRAGCISQDTYLLYYMDKSLTFKRCLVHLVNNKYFLIMASFSYHKSFPQHHFQLAHFNDLCKYLSLALCFDHLVDHHLSSERRAQQCTTRGAAEMGNSKFQKYFSLITSPLTSQVFPPPFNCDNNHHPMSGILSKSNHVL